MRRPFENHSRRDLLKLFGVSFGATLAGAALPLKVQAAQAPAASNKITPRKTARNCIVIQNCGAMSPWETLDVKLTKYTAPDLDLQQINPEFNVSKTLFPNYQIWAPKVSLVRSLRGNALVHFPAQYHTQAGRALNPGILREVPAFGSIVASELERERRTSDSFPTFMSFDLWNARCPNIGPGMLSPRFAGLDLNTSNVFTSFADDSSSEHHDATLMSDRWQALSKMMEVSDAVYAELGQKAEEYQAHYEYAYRLLSDPRFKKVLAVTDEDRKRYGVAQDNGAAKISLAMILARNTLAADAGARMLWVSNSYNGGNGGFDNHTHLYGRGQDAPRGAFMSIYESAPRFDRAFSSLIQDLSTMPGHERGKTLLDETLIVVAHEFGRTTDMNPAGGRDHNANLYTNLFIGGGVKPGRIVGKTDDTGAKMLDVGWKFKEQPMMDHVASTVYSALGIDYGKKIGNTPSGRDFEYQQTAPLGGPAFIPRTDIAELFE